MIRLAKGLLGFCVLGLAVLAVGKPATASTVTVNFAGTLTNIAPVGGNPLGGTIGDGVSGSLSFGPVAGPFNSSGPTTDVTTYWSANTTWTFSLGGVGGGGLTTLTLYDEHITPTADYGADFFVDGLITGHPDRSLDLWTRAYGADETIAPLTLATIPATLNDWAARFIVATVATGSVSYGGTTYSFDLTKMDVATTPLPGSLPLLGSAMLSLGVLVWRRHKTVPAPVG